MTKQIKGKSGTTYIIEGGGGGYRFTEYLKKLTDTDYDGFETETETVYEDERFDTLEEGLAFAGHNRLWGGWANFPTPDSRASNWIYEDIEEVYFKDHNREERSLHIERVDGRPLNQSEMDLITRTFGLKY